MYLRKKSWHRRVKYSLKAVEAKVITKAIQGIGDITEYRSSQWFSSHKSVLFFAAAALPKRGGVAALSWSLVLSEWTSWAAGRPRMYFPALNCPCRLSSLHCCGGQGVCVMNLDESSKYQGWKPWIFTSFRVFVSRYLQMQRATTIPVAFRIYFQDFISSCKRYADIQ